MAPPPIALGLVLCDYVLVEEGTRKVSLIGSFSHIAATRFPALAQPFSAWALLTDGLGAAKIRLVLSHLDTQNEVASWEMSFQFPDKLAEVRVHFRRIQCVYPAPGWYQFTLYVDDQWVAHRRIEVYLKENAP